MRSNTCMKGLDRPVVGGLIRTAVEHLEELGTSQVEHELEGKGRGGRGRGEGGGKEGRGKGEGRRGGGRGEGGRE